MTTERRRSPYLVIGVPFGAPPKVAAKGFARATKRLRRTVDAPFAIEDLSWALHAIEQRVEDPAASIDDFRMPANPAVYESSPSAGLLNLEISVLERLTPPTPRADLESLRRQVVTESVAGLVAEIEDSPLPTLHYFLNEER